MKLKELCNLYIPTINIKSEFQPPWFDNETFKLCRKKERLRAKFKVSKNPIHYQNYSKCRSNLKELIHKKMRANIVDDDEDDPSIISKKFWQVIGQCVSHVVFRPHSAHVLSGHVLSGHVLSGHCFSSP